MHARAVDLADFIRKERDTILRHWEERVRGTNAPSKEQARSALIDHLPDLLESIAKNAGAASASERVPLHDSVSGRHASERLEQGYCLAEVVMEYVELRSCVFERLEELGLVIEPRQSRILHRAVDQALRETARRYVVTHEKMLRAIDHITGRQAVARSLDDALDDILVGMRHAAGAEVDSVTLLLVEDDGRLHVRATLGLEEERDTGFTLAFDEGFAGRVATTARPVLLRDAANDAIVVSPSIRKRGTRALYGVPLLDDDARVIGVAHIGSCVAYEFAEEDLMLFRAMCERATTAILRVRFVEALERTSRFREQFIGILGHDLRSPLSAVLGTMHILLQDEEVPDRIRPSLQRAARSAARMEALISDLLDFTRARLGGGFQLRRAPASLLEIARDAADEQTTRLSGRTLCVDGSDVRGEWDRDRLAQLLANLIGNAVQHSPDGSAITVHVRRDGDAGVLEVWNEGPPIADDTKLFEPFERATNGGSGLGLGLFIAREIVAAHGGTIAVRSDEGGTTFTVRLPLSGAVGQASVRSRNV